VHTAGRGSAEPALREGAACQGSRVTSIEEARAAALVSLRYSGVPLVEVVGALEPKDGGRLLVVIDGAVEALKHLITITRPTFAAVTPVAHDEFSVHLAGTPWVALSVSTQEAWDEADEADDEDRGEHGFDPEVRALLEGAIPQIAEATPIGDHRSVHWPHDALVGWLNAHHPDFADKLNGHDPQSALWDLASDLQNTLKAAHAAAMRRDAATWAAQIDAADPVPPGASKPVLRDIAWRHMRIIDERCATKVAVEGIVVELATIARSRG